MVADAGAVVPPHRSARGRVRGAGPFQWMARPPASPDK
jgi:hypothetical protein